MMDQTLSSVIADMIASFELTIARYHRLARLKECHRYKYTADESWADIFHTVCQIRGQTNSTMINTKNDDASSFE